VILPAKETTPASGKQMYVNYCAPCHGVNSRGSGPVAIALKVPPSDLTVLSKNNHGKFPDSHIATVLQNGVEISGHGSFEMPAWGPIFSNMNATSPQDRMIRINNLSRYLETFQVK
jgi:mono/diheme cytochrome c family protein